MNIIISDNSQDYCGPFVEECWNPNPVINHPWNSDQYMIPNPYTYPQVQWKVKVNDDKNAIVLTLDLPGVKLSDLNVNFKDGVLTVESTRFDNRVMSTTSYILGTNYDPTSIKAILESGVLSITAKKLSEFNSRKITVKEKI